jgi:cysteine desulfurase/selenocysteine lyase
MHRTSARLSSRNATKASTSSRTPLGGPRRGPVTSAHLGDGAPLDIVPWQACEERGARLRVAPIDDRGELRLDEFERLLGERTKLASVTHMSNALGTINPVEEIVRIAHRQGVPVLLDGSQAAYHMPVDVQTLDCDFYAATGHKLYGPTGMGILYGKEAHLESMPPFLCGGDNISSVTFEKSTWNNLPHKF